MQDGKLDAGAFATAMNGLVAGTIGTWALDRIDWLMWEREGQASRERTVSVRPQGEPPAGVAASKLEEMLGLEPSEERHAATGQAIHFAIGIAPAVAYAFARDKLPGRGVARGLMFGASAFLLQDELMNTMSGLGAKPKDYPWQAHARGLIAHLLYGVVTELTLDAIDRSGKRLAGRYERPDGEAAGERRGLSRPALAAS